MMLLLLSLSFASQVDDEARRTWMGTWELIGVIKDGKEEADPLGSKTLFHFAADGTYEGKANTTQLGQGTYKPNPKTKPAAVDWTAAGRSEFDGKLSKPVSSVGIYQIENDILTIVLKLEGKADERPADFTCKAGSGHYLMKLKRVAR